jgi:hypothetical protein
MGRREYTDQARIQRPPADAIRGAYSEINTTAGRGGLSEPPPLDPDINPE